MSPWLLDILTPPERDPSLISARSAAYIAHREAKARGDKRGMNAAWKPLYDMTNALLRAEVGR